MKKFFLLLLLVSSQFVYSQCFDCAKNYGGWVGDETAGIEKTVDGMVYMVEAEWESTINKYDFDCNLIWSKQINSLFSDLRSVTSDEFGNIYILMNFTLNPSAGPEPWNVDGFEVFSGLNFFKLSPDGTILWSRHFYGSNVSGMQRIYYYQNTLLITGTFPTGLTFPNGLSFSFPYTDHPRAFIAKYNSDGDFIDAVYHGTGIENFMNSEFDSEGNIYLTNIHYNHHYSNLVKFNSSLQLSWSTELSNSNTNDTSVYIPQGLRYNNENNKVYIWGAISQTTTILGNTYFVSDSNGLFQSVLTEFDATDGTLTNIERFDNNSVNSDYSSSSLGFRGAAFMAEKDNYLYVFTGFRETMVFSNATVTSTPNTSEIIAGPNISYQEELVLFRVDLSDFSSEFVTKSYGVPNLNYSVIECAGAIVFNGDDLYLTASFESNPMQINGSIINNNSGNNDSDAMYYKFNINDTGGGVTFSNSCLSDNTDFYLSGNFDSVEWDFDDPASGALNTSTDTNPTHVFTNAGTYNVSTTVNCGNGTETKITAVTITNIPTINQIDDLYSCEDEYGSQISSSFNTTQIENDLIGNQSDIIISYFDADGNELPSPLPNPMTNTVEGTQTITARLAKATNQNCYVETSFNLVTIPLPEPIDSFSIYACDEDNDGFTLFDLSSIADEVLTDPVNFEIVFIDNTGNEIPEDETDDYGNNSVDEVITLRMVNLQTQCYSETPVSLVPKPAPVANNIDEVIGCDSNGDGIANFSLSEIRNQVLAGQTGLEVSYFDADGNPFPTPMPIPFRNTVPYNQQMIVRVTDPDTGCYGEATVSLKVTDKPKINQPQDRYACEDSSGIGTFDTSGLDEEITGGQTGLTVAYFNADGVALPSPLPVNFNNTVPYHQTMYVKVYNSQYPECYSETLFDLNVNKRPVINLEEEYTICELQSYLRLTVAPNYHSYEWKFNEDGTVVSTNYYANLTKAGSYTLTVSKTQYGLSCESSFTFVLNKTPVVEIAEVHYSELGNNQIEVITTGGYDPEYSLDGINYTSNNWFTGLSGGIYTVYVRDREGCGEDTREVILLDYPHYFTPNGDGVNDYWQIFGISKFPLSKTYIFDRYGKLLTYLPAQSIGWDGKYNGAIMPSSDYWFKTILDNGFIFSGHFALKR